MLYMYVQKDKVYYDNYYYKELQLSKYIMYEYDTTHVRAIELVFKF